MKKFYISRRNNKSGKDSHFVLKSENNRWHESEVEPGGRLSLPKLLSREINTGKQNVHPFIAPDDSC
jgi:hypothetical protein